MQVCSGSGNLNLWLSKYLMALIFKNHALFLSTLSYIYLHLEVELGIRIKHRHPTELKFLNLILLSLLLDRSTHLTLTQVCM